MRVLYYTFILPITILSMLYTKWWYVSVIDGPIKDFVGFPFIYIGDGPSSLSYEIYVLELIANFFVYFIGWTLLYFILRRYVSTIVISKGIQAVLITFSSLVLVLHTLVYSAFDVTFYMKRNRNFDVEVLDTGGKFLFLDTPITTKKLE